MTPFLPLFLVAGVSVKVLREMQRERALDAQLWPFRTQIQTPTQTQTRQTERDRERRRERDVEDVRDAEGEGVSCSTPVCS